MMGGGGGGEARGGGGGGGMQMPYWSQEGRSKHQSRSAVHYGMQ